MSNKAVSATYRTVIDDVIANVRQDFEDMGIEKEVLDELQRSWEAKIVATGVADFEGAAPVQPRRKQQQQAQVASSSSNVLDKEANSAVVKQEEAEVKLSNDGESAHKRARLNGDGAARNVHHTASDPAAGGRESNPLYPSLASNAQASSDTNDADGEDVNGNKRKRPVADDDEIGSDLDDSDEDEMEGNIDADGNEDMILCLYDKVQRVRNKWKCVLKDGVASIDGRDYVFSKLSSELEW